MRRTDKKFRPRAPFVHLDGCFTHVAGKQALTLPWFLEASQAGKDPYTQVHSGMAAHRSISDEDLGAACDVIRDLGLVRLSRAGSAEEDAGVKSMKLVDRARRRGYTVHFVRVSRQELQSSVICSRRSCTNTSAKVQM